MNKLVLLLLLNVGGFKVFSQENVNLVLIPDSSFESGSYVEDSSFFYKCKSCQFEIEYLRFNSGIEEFIVNSDTFLIKECLVPERFKFYKTEYKGSNYLVLSSPDARINGKSYSLYKNYYLFKIDGKDIKFKKEALSKSTKEEFFLKNEKRGN